MGLRTFTGIGFLVALVLLGSAPTALCSSIVVDPDPGTPPPGEFWYSLAVPEPGGITFNPGDEIVFSGMSGVTDAFANVCSDLPPFSCQRNADGELGFSFGNFVTFTDTTATFAFGFPASCTFCLPSETIANDGGAPFGTLVIDPPSDVTVGAIQWAIIQGGVTTFSGTVPGPVAAVVTAPEPSTLMLLCAGLLGLVGGGKKSIFRKR